MTFQPKRTFVPRAANGWKEPNLWIQFSCCGRSQREILPRRRNAAAARQSEMRSFLRHAAIRIHGHKMWTFLSFTKSIPIDSACIFSAHSLGIGTLSASGWPLVKTVSITIGMHIVWDPRAATNWWPPSQWSN